MSETAIVTAQTREIGPAVPIEEVTRRYRQMAEFARNVMRENVDFGAVPGTDKPTLLKPGAEKLAVLFGLTVEFTLVDRQEEWDKPFFFYRYEGRLIHRETGHIIGNAFGSCNSREKKYRWRRVPEWEASEEEKALAVRSETRTSKKGNEYTMIVIENPDIYDLVNTFDKMAQKRALVAAVLVGTGASEFFTQDVEDLPEFVEKEPEPELAPKRQRRPQQKPRNGRAGHSWPGSIVKWALENLGHYYQAPAHVVNALNSSGLTPKHDVAEIQDWLSSHAAQRMAEKLEQEADDGADSDFE